MHPDLIPTHLPSLPRPVRWTGMGRVLRLDQHRLSWAGGHLFWDHPVLHVCQTTIPHANARLEHLSCRAAYRLPASTGTSQDITSPSPGSSRRRSLLICYYCVACPLIHTTVAYSIFSNLNRPSIYFSKESAGHFEYIRSGSRSTSSRDRSIHRPRIYGIHTIVLAFDDTLSAHWTRWPAKVLGPQGEVIPRAAKDARPASVVTSVVTKRSRSGQYRFPSTFYRDTNAGTVETARSTKSNAITWRTWEQSRRDRTAPSSPAFSSRPDPKVASITGNKQEAFLTRIFTSSHLHRRKSTRGTSSASSTTYLRYRTIL